MTYKDLESQGILPTCPATWRPAAHLTYSLILQQPLVSVCQIVFLLCHSFFIIHFGHLANAITCPAGFHLVRKISLTESWKVKQYAPRTGMYIENTQCRQQATRLPSKKRRGAFLFVLSQSNIHIIFALLF